MPTYIKFFIIYFSSLLLTIFLFTLGILLRKQRKLLYRLHRMYRDTYYPPRQQELPLVPLSKIITTNHVISVAEPISVQGNVTAYEQISLNNLIKEFAPQVIFEIGTFDGRSTLNFGLNAPEDVHIYTFDLPKETTSKALLNVSDSDQRLIEKNVTGSRFLTPEAKQLLGQRTITQLFGDTATFDFSPYYNSCDFVFVDAAHTYDYVTNDSAIALKLLKDNKGIILWHDYDDKHEGSVQAIDEFASTHPDWNMFHIENTNIAGLIL